LLAIPRIILALFIGLVIAKPIELKLFEKEINAQIESIDAKPRQTAENSSLISRISALEELSRKEPLVTRTQLFINLLFVLVTASPVLVILLSPSGVYETVAKDLERRALVELETENKLQRDLQISKIKVYEITIRYLEEQIFSVLETPDFRSETYNSVIMSLKNTTFRLTQAQLSSARNTSIKMSDKEVDEAEKAISRNYENEPILHSSHSQLDEVEIPRLLGESYQKIIQDIEMKYSSELKAKEREIELYQEYSNDLQELSERLASQPIIIDSEQKNDK
jgi:Domain of unknown function (DUF4407)